MGRKRTEITFLPSVCDIDFSFLKKQGIETVLFDIEGTIAPWGATQVDADIHQCIERSGIRKIGIVTNLNKAHAERAKNFAQQIVAQSYQFPKTRKDRKPSPRMIHACIRELESSPEQTVMVGDKLLDVLAARNAGLPRVFWLNKLDGPDHWFDRWIYRRIEPLLKKMMTS